MIWVLILVTALGARIEVTDTASYEECTTLLKMGNQTKNPGSGIQFECEEMERR
jgi:hypothetical protein